MLGGRGRGRGIGQDLSAFLRGSPRHSVPREAVVRAYEARVAEEEAVRKRQREADDRAAHRDVEAARRARRTSPERAAERDRNREAQASRRAGQTSPERAAERERNRADHQRSRQQRAVGQFDIRRLEATRRAFQRELMPWLLDDDELAANDPILLARLKERRDRAVSVYLCRTRRVVASGATFR